MDRQDRALGGATVAIALLVAAIVAFAPLSGSAQQSGVGAGGAEPVPGPYTQAQAEAGAQVYRARCANCHLPDLAGSFEASSLVGAQFGLTSGNRPVTELLNLVSEAMPPLEPGSLTPGDYAAVVAYILERNRVSPGEIALGPISSGTVIPGMQAAEQAAEPVVPPVPGRIGTGPAPGSLASAPDTPADIYETPRSITRTFRPLAQFSSVSQADLDSPPIGDWLHWRGNAGSWGYSALDQINTDNVDRLQLAWVWPM